MYNLGIYLFTTAFRTALGPTQPPIQWLSGSLSLEVKRPEREAHHSPPYSAEVKNACTYTSTHPYAFILWCSVKAQRQFYIYLLHFTFILQPYLCYSQQRESLLQFTFLFSCQLLFKTVLQVCLSTTGEDTSDVLCLSSLNPWAPSPCRDLLVTRGGGRTPRYALTPYHSAGTRRPSTCVIAICLLSRGPICGASTPSGHSVCELCIYLRNFAFVHNSLPRITEIICYLQFLPKHLAEDTSVTSVFTILQFINLPTLDTNSK
jgi:hypothetical protein